MLMELLPQRPPPRQEPLWPHAGETVDHFQLLEPLGRGEQSRVFLAADASLDQRRVVVKFVPKGSSEAILLARTEHPHVMPVLHVTPVPSRGISAICMPFLGRATLCEVIGRIAGHPKLREQTIASVAADCVAVGWLDPQQPAVRALLKSKRHSIDWLLQIVIDVADAVGEAHRRGVMHRDIKPSNVLISFSAEPMLLDFNLARGAAAWTTEGGTVPYMAPERLPVWMGRFTGDDVEGAPPSDVFSLGVTLYESLTGRLPFALPDRAGSREELVARMLELHRAGSANVQVGNRGVNRSLARLVHATLRMDARQRPQSMDELAAALKQELRLRSRTARFIRREPVRAAAIAATSAAALVVAIPVLNYAANRLPIQSINAFRDIPSPKDFDGLVQHGLEQLDNGAPDEALADFHQALRVRKDGYVAALAATAVLRQGGFTARTKMYLDQADAAGYTSVAHQNNWAVYELRLGKAAAALARLTPLLDSASDAERSTVLLNWLEAELQDALSRSRAPDFVTAISASEQCTLSPLHELLLTELCAQVLAARSHSFDGMAVNHKLFESGRLAAEGGISSAALDEVTRVLPRLKSDVVWRQAVGSAPRVSSVRSPQHTLIPQIH